jgi:AbrB family looped-hinge helix DNA binding protein
VSRITSKLQVTIPKAIAEAYGLEPGDEVDWLPASGAIRVVPRARVGAKPGYARRLALFDRATERQSARQASRPIPAAPPERGRGWTRDELYNRGGTR